MWMRDNQEPIIIEADTVPKNVYFIISGQIHIMNKEGLYEYGTLSDGSYFGDISLLLDQKEEFSYFYNPHHHKPITMITIRAEKFLEICNKYPLSKDVMMKRSNEKNQIFRNYKTITLIKYMRGIIRKPDVLYHNYNESWASFHKMKIDRDLKISLMKSFVRMWYVHR
jgi:signal-transduction protein with cAMP-binding, CBS, and nucleotidyltransferase domain